MMINRRNFILLASSAITVRPAFAAETAEKIYFGGPILTMNDANPLAEAVAVNGKRIIAVGSNAAIMKYKRASTIVVDLEGKTMVPGFVDAHGHIIIGGVQALSANLLPPPDGPGNGITTIQNTLREWWMANEEAVKKINLIIGFGYDQSQLKELRHPDRKDLDAVSETIPIVIVHQSGHLAVFNSKALEMVNYSSETPDPIGGIIQRRPNSREPNGVLEETAFMTGIPKLLKNIGPEGLKVFIEAGAELWSSFGYTTVQEGRAVPSLCKAMEDVAAAGKFNVDVVVYPDALVDRDYIRKNVSAKYTNRYRVGGAKISIDGSPQGFTAWRDRPYYAPVGNYTPGYVGYPAAPSEKFIDTIDWAFANNIQTITHANGEAASDLLIASLASAEDKHGKSDRRHVLIHGQFEREDQVDSFVKLGVIPSLFPMHTYYWGDWHRDHTVGPELADNISPTGWYLKRGSIFTSHHDAPVAFPNSMRILDSTVTRRSRSGDIIGPTQRVSVSIALKAMTIWPAYQHFEENEKGSIEKGKLADFAILSDNPITVDVELLDQIDVLETIKEGKSIYVSGAKKADFLRKEKKDFVNTAMHEMLKQIYVQFEIDRLPQSYKTNFARNQLATNYEECSAALLLPRLFGLPIEGTDVASGGTERYTHLGL